MNAWFAVCEIVWKVLGIDVLGKKMHLSACDEIKALILSIIDLKNKKLKIIRKEGIANCLESLNQRIAKFSKSHDEFVDKIGILGNQKKTMQEKDEALKELIDLLEVIPLTRVDCCISDGNPRKELQMIQNSNWVVRLAAFNDWKIISRGEKYQRTITLSNLLHDVKMKADYSGGLYQIKSKTIDGLNAIFELELWNSITAKEIPDTDFYCKHFGEVPIINEFTQNKVFEELLYQKEIGALRSFVYRFYESFVKSEEEKQYLHSRLVEGKLDKIILGILEKVEAVTDGFSQNFQETFEKVDSRYIILSGELENVREVQEEDVINAVIGQEPKAYQKKFANE